MPMSLDEALNNLKSEVIRALRIVPMLDWLARHMPPWAERIPAPPRWMGFMFWIYAAVAVQFAPLAYAALTGNLR